MSWACLVPRNDESAGKRRSRRMRKGGTWLKTTMGQCAWAAKRKGGSRFATLFGRLKPKLGAGRAICAVAAEMLRKIYHMLKDGTCYEANRAECRVATRHEEPQRLLRRLTRLGFAAEIKPIASTAG